MKKTKEKLSRRLALLETLEMDELRTRHLWFIPDPDTGIHYLMGTHGLYGTEEPTDPHPLLKKLFPKPGYQHELEPILKQHGFTKYNFF